MEFSFRLEFLIKSDCAAVFAGFRYLFCCDSQNTELFERAWSFFFNPLETAAVECLAPSGPIGVSSCVCIFGHYSDTNTSNRQREQMPQLPRPQPLKTSSTLLLLLMPSPQQAGKAGRALCVVF